MSKRAAAHFSNGEKLVTVIAFGKQHESVSKTCARVNASR